MTVAEAVIVDVASGWDTVLVDVRVVTDVTVDVVAGRVVVRVLWQFRTLVV